MKIAEIKKKAHQNNPSPADLHFRDFLEAGSLDMNNFMPEETNVIVKHLTRQETQNNEAGRQSCPPLGPPFTSRQRKLQQSVTLKIGNPKIGPFKNLSSRNRNGASLVVSKSSTTRDLNLKCIRGEASSAQNFATNRYTSTFSDQMTLPLATTKSKKKVKNRGSISDKLEPITSFATKLQLVVKQGNLMAT